ncbi:4Fe-4S dicluster domain-containing protein [Chondrinema litorale]|uniref:4Fe-4S dicluster domain-containing protein n=1 Tax=Chondrinema litorale TaxID=2994555 RepID=UPI002543960B|nr:4Fe-4S dicluster domain-containing protein [Chondrinema litorale]UZR95076.1 4Fe-4S dicluster domain-containing protein [Chondrinema litorale]
MKGANNTYFGSVKEAVKTTIAGAKVTVKHLKNAIVKERRDAIPAVDDNYFAKKEGIVTLRYPKEEIPVPDNGRYKLHNEIDDCIVCDKCAKICPVNCIDIEPVKATEVIGNTSDGTAKRLYAAKFDIDMAKCCFCGLCTTVCPTECLTMTKDYDFSEFDVTEMNYGFATMTPEEADEKRRAYDAAQEAKKAKTLAAEATSEVKDSPKKPVVRRAVRPVAKKSSEPNTEEKKATPAKPAFKPKMKSKPVVKKSSEETSGEEKTVRPKVRPKVSAKVKPVMKKPEGEEQTSSESAGEEVKKSRPVIRPKISAKVKPVMKKPEGEEQKPSETTGEEVKKSRPVIRPKISAKVKPVMKKPEGEEQTSSEATGDEVKKSRPVIRPKISAKVKPVMKKPVDKDESENTEEPKKEDAKPKYKPKMKAKIRPVNKKTDSDNSVEKED